MAEHRRLDGVVKLAATGGTVAEILNVTSFSLEEQTETIDVTSMSSTGSSREILATFLSFTGSIDGYWDKTDTQLNQDTDGVAPDIRAGETIDFELYPEGEGSGVLYYSGSAIVTSVSRNASYDGAVEYSIAFDGTGPLTYNKSA